MANSALDTKMLDRAIVFAVEAHGGTERRGKGFPYIVHPLEAMAIVATMTTDQELLAAAVLHDTVEDTEVSVEQLKEVFGERVAAIVDDESDIEVKGESKAESWHVRKEHTLSHLRQSSHESKIVALGDKLSNMRAIARDYATFGDDIWQQFHVKDRAAHEWYYRGLVEALRDLQSTTAFQEFEALVERVFSPQGAA